MRFIKILLLILFSINIQNNTNAANMPASFADLAEKLMPSVVNISTTKPDVSYTHLRAHETCGHIE